MADSKIAAHFTNARPLFWKWFKKNEQFLKSDAPENNLLNEFLDQLHLFDSRLYFLISTNQDPNELIITAEGNSKAFESAESLVSSAPEIEGWAAIALKPPMGFDFIHQDGKIRLHASKLWFMPLHSEADPKGLGIMLGMPNVDFVLDNQSVDTAYTILESGIGERSCTEDIAHLVVSDLPDSPAEEGYIELDKLASYIAFHKRRVSSHP
ncbi:MAG: hypothetical protein RH917_02280 [Lacipirellulaceae bacterium]